MPGDFFDSNVLLYLASDPRKAKRSRELLAGSGTISVQVLNEIANVCIRKMKLSWGETHELLSDIRSLLTVADLTVADHEQGLAIAERYRISLYDSMIVAAALNAGCDTLYSEDMQDGLIIDGRLRLVNPFAAV